ILTDIKTETIILDSSKNIIPRSPLKRAEYRMNKFKKYLANVESYAVSRKLIHGTPIGSSEGIIAGLYTQEECIALGVIESLDRENVVFSSPSINIKAIKKIKIGKINLKSLLNETS
ncbi:MAG: hypothetical protein N2482_03745, partial [Patescibacteria group bacterium]|nr:hypothetical protein [Patescibacteria group bacterium]